MAKKEEYIAICRKHWTVYVKKVIFAILCLAISITPFFLKNFKIDIVVTVLMVFFFALAVLTVVYIVLHYRFTYIALTKTAFSSHIFSILPYENIRISFEHILGATIITGVRASILNCHTITVNCIGMNKEHYEFKHMAKAEQFVRQIPTNPILRRR